MKPSARPTSLEHKMANNDFIVSKTDLKGHITYANRTLLKIGQYPLNSLLNVQHNIIRHPDMPRGVFKLLWDTLKQGDEFFGFIKNMCANGDYYWLFANVTPDSNIDGKLHGYYSVRRQPPEKALSIEKRLGAKEGPEKSIMYLNQILAEQNVSYRDFSLNLFKS